MNLRHLSADTRRALIDGLEALSASPDNVKDKRFGICWNLQHIVSERAGGLHDAYAYDLVGYISVDWPGLVGKVEADGTKRWCPYPLGRARYALWEGDGLAQRLDLMAYLIKRLKEA